MEIGSNKDKRDKKSTSSKDHQHKQHKQEKERSTKDKKKNKRAKSSDSSDGERQRQSPTHDKKNSKKRHIEESNENNKSEGGGASEKAELSIEETNKLREKLGLKPLQVDNKSEGGGEKDKQTNNVSAEGNKIYRDKKTDEVFEHVPAKNQTALKEEKKFREKLEEQREKRKLVTKIRSNKGLGESDSEDDSALNWVQKVKEKQEAEKKAKSLEEMDRQFEAEEEKPVVKVKPKKTTNYTQNDLSGLRVEHAQETFKEGQAVILTLKDKYVLDEAEDDVLVNVNIIDEEKAKKNVENKKKKPAYKPYDEFDEYGNFQEKSILEKYNEDLEGEKKKSFKIGTGGVYDTSMDKFIEQQNEEFKSKAIRLDVNSLKVAKDYMTQEEQEAFKKPKKLRKKIRKAVKADDLLPLEEEEQSSFGSRKSGKQEREEGEINEEDFREKRKKQMIEAAADSSSTKKLTLKDLNLDFNKKRRNESDEDDGDDDGIKREPIIDDKFRLDDDDAFSDLHNALDKVRKRVVSNKIDEIAKRIAEEDTTEVKNEPMTSYDELVEVDDGRALTLDSMSEFCRNLGDLPATRGVKKFEKEDFDNVEAVKNMSKKSMDVDEDEDEEMMNYDSNSDDEGNEKNNVDESNAQPILDNEPQIDRGLASALALAVNKGYLDEKKFTQNARLKLGQKDEISALNYTVEEKSFYDIDDKYARNNRDRYSGPISDFREKDGYKPDVKLDYVDDKGHRMNEKEAFRYLSHRFHGKGPGKKKTEKRLNKLKELESMNKMSSVDTPLSTVALLVEKQKKLQQPYVVLTAPKAEIPLHKR